MRHMWVGTRIKTTTEIGKLGALGKEGGAEAIGVMHGVSKVKVTLIAMTGVCYSTALRELFLCL